LKILHLSTRLILGGSQENTVLSCEGQARLGHEVHLAFGPIYGPEGSLLSRIEEFNARCGRGEERTRTGGAVMPIRTHVIDDLVREVSLTKDRRARASLRGFIADLRPDIVHTHSSKAGVLGRLAAWDCVRAGQKIGVVHTIHGPPFMPLEGSVVGRAKIGLTNWVYTLAERRAAKCCHVIVSVADAMTRTFRARGIGRDEQYVTVRSGMETEPYTTPEPNESRVEMRELLGLKDDQFVIGTVARLAQHKGHADLLAAVRRITDSGGDASRIVLLWVGDGWLRDELVRDASAGARPFNVIELGQFQKPHERQLQAAWANVDASRPTLLLRGLVPPQRVPGLMRAMDVLAHTSSREGLPRTVPQALLAGVCPVAYDCDGTGEACIDGVTGRLVRTGDVSGLTRALTELRGDAAQRERLASAGREFCLRRFSVETMIEELGRVYERAMR
jgi:glycosyltransferase involved in cell wall biosynthesis